MGGLQSKVKRTEQERATKTKQRILAAAMQEFAELGFAGARVDRIVRRARVNKQAVYYYFGSKEEMYRASLALAYGKFMPKTGRQAADPPPEQTMRELIGAIFDHVRANEEGASIISHENRHYGRHLTPELRKQIRSSVAPLINAVSRILRSGQVQGVFKTNIEPVHLYLSIMCLCMFYFSNIHTLSAILNQDLGTGRMASAWRSHVIEFIVDSLSSKSIKLNG